MVDFSLHYWVRVVPGDRPGFVARTGSYDHSILDRDGRELVAFHWEPDGIGTVCTPHVHLSAAAAIVLPQRTGSPLTQAKTHLGRLHLPSGPIGVEDVVELLIRDFAAVPLRPDWQRVLDDNRRSAAEEV